MNSTNQPTQPALRRAIGLPLLVLYGLGITIGAGIYVLIGETAAVAGIHAPAAFLVAAFVMTFSALSFSEFSGRVPQSAGEAVYVDAAFGVPWLTNAVGLSIAAAATIAGAAISLGCAGYIVELLGLPKAGIAVVVILLMGLLAARGVLESLVFAAILTVIEILGLVVIVWAGFQANPDIITQVPSVFPDWSNGLAWNGIFAASLIAFFAFIGFDDIVNMVEETKEPKRIMPWAIIIALVAVTVIYFLVMFVAVQSIAPSQLEASDAPVGLLFERLTGMSPLSITLVAIVATLNGVVIEIIIAARVIYGLGKRHLLPQALAKVDPKRRTPLNATILVTLVMVGLALVAPLETLASLTSQIILAVFAMVNLSLVVVKARGVPAPEGVFTVHIAFPAIGIFACLFLLVGPLIFF